MFRLCWTAQFVIQVLKGLINVMNRKVLVTGASGMLGATLAKVLFDKFEVFATGNSDYESTLLNYMKFDLSNGDYDKLIKWSRPDVIIHCGALTNGNYCKENPLEAFNVNGISVKKLIEATDEEVKIVYISSDAVFPSKLHLAKESDLVFPENVYGKSKELGEFFLQISNRDYTIVRTTIVGLNLNKTKSGFVEWIINSSKNKESISLFDDVLFNPISIWDLTNELIYLIDKNLISGEILHISGRNFCTKHEFGIALLNELNLPTNKVVKGSIKELVDRAKRCTDQSMNCSYFENKYSRVLPSLKDTVQQIKKHYYEQY